MSDLNDDQDLQALRSLRGVGTPTTVALSTPPPEIWDRIASEVGLAPADNVLSIARPSRARWRRGLVALAAAAVVLTGALTALRAQRPKVVASIDLERLLGDASGHADLVKDRGRLQIRLEASGLDASGGYLEVWMIDPGVTKLVSLGPLRADGIYDVPAGVLPSQYPVVDVSIEPLDGNPAHSGKSVLRGSLPL